MLLRSCAWIPVDRETQRQQPAKTLVLATPRPRSRLVFYDSSRSSPEVALTYVSRVGRRQSSCSCGGVRGPVVPSAPFPHKTREPEVAAQGTQQVAVAGTGGATGSCETLAARGVCGDPFRVMSLQNPKVDAFVSRAKAWQREIQKLRSILLGCGLDEELKWGKPCFVFEERNIAIIQPFKEHCSLMFFKGALLEDTHGLLRHQGQNTQSAMRLEFTSEAQIEKTVVKSYVTQAIAAEKSGLKVDFKAKRELELPEELTQILKKDRKLAKAFHALTPGRQRGYVLHFAGAKQARTRTARIEKCISKILAGVGVNDR